MAEKKLHLHQQLALMPDLIPDSVIDFLEDFYEGVESLSGERVKAALVDGYMQASGSTLKKELDAVKQALGKIHSIEVGPISENNKSAFMCKLSSVQTFRGIGFIMNLQTQKIEQVLVVNAEFVQDDFQKKLLSLIR